MSTWNCFSPASFDALVQTTTDFALHPAQRLADHLLGAVDGRGVEQIDPEIERLADQRDRVVLRLAGAQPELAEPAAAKPGDTHFQPGAPERGVFHDPLPTSVAPQRIKPQGIKVRRMTRPCLIVGHRGARGLYPENTLTAFAGALALGVDALELDVALTADGLVVVSHDPALNPNITRDAAGAWLAEPGPLIRSLTAAQLAAYDVGRLRPGTRYAALFPDQSPRDGERIPPLADVLRLADRARFVIELKTFPARPATQRQRTRTGRRRAPRGGRRRRHRRASRSRASTGVARATCTAPGPRLRWRG